jgi:hypothetical protein
MSASALVLAALVGRPRPRRVLLVAVALAALAVAIGPRGGLYTVLAWVFPPARAVRYPMKALILTSLAGSLLGGMGLDAWREGSVLSGRRRLVITAGLLLLVLVAAAGLVLPRIGGERIGAWLFLPEEEAGLSDADAGSAGAPAGGPDPADRAALLATILTGRRPAMARTTLVVGRSRGCRPAVRAQDLNPTAPRELLGIGRPTSTRCARPPRAWVCVYDDSRSRRWLGHPKGLYATTASPELALP